MPDEYLWDRSGPPDVRIASLETLLADYRYRAPKPRWRPTRTLLAAAAAVVLCASLGLWLRRPPAPASEWKLAGQAIAVGHTIRTNAAGARLEADQIGDIALEPNSSLKVLPSLHGRQQLALQRGTLHALIWAPPARLVVATPSAATIDLGCAYTLTVLPDDSGLLTVQSGWVAFQAGARESFIPAGAACRTRVRSGPGLPYFEDATPAFRGGIERFESSDGRQGLGAILGAARRRDALTLWHLAVRTAGRDREAVVERFAALVPGVDAVGLQSGSASAMDNAWNLLELGGADWWRMWKHDWRP